jgi:hypothetical protein
VTMRAVEHQFRCLMFKPKAVLPAPVERRVYRVTSGPTSTRSIGAGGELGQRYGRLSSTR